MPPRAGNGSFDGARRVAGWIACGGLSLWALAWIWRWRLPVDGLLHAGEIAAAAGLFGAALLTGLGLSRGLGCGMTPPPERIVHSLALGLGALIVPVLVLGLFGALSRPAALGAMLLVAAAGAAAGWGRLPDLAGALRSLRPGPAEAAGLAALALVLAMPLAASLLPQAFYDSLLYHLEAPERWLGQGSLAMVPFSVHLNYPVNVSVLYLLHGALVPGGSAAPVHWGFLAAAAASLVALGGRLGRGVGILAAALFCLTPSALEIGGLAIADHAVVFFTLAAASAWLSWRETGERKLLLVCGLEVGLAVGAKYTGILVALLPLALLTLAAPGERGMGRRLRDAAILSAAAGLIFSPWLVRNFLGSGNPIYPYLLPARGEFATPHQLATELGNRMVEGEGVLRHAARGPWELLNGGVGAAPLVGIALFLPLPLLLLRRRLPSAAAAILAMAGLGFVAWDLTVHVTRYALPWLALLALPAAAALVNEPDRRWRRWIGTLVGIGLAHGAFLGWMAVDWEALRGLWRGARTRDQYLERLVSYYPAVRHANEELGPADRILFFGEARGYYCAIEHVTNGPERPPRLYEIAAAASGGPLSAALRRQGFTHLLLSRSEIERYTRQGRLAPPGPAVEVAVRELLTRDLDVLFDDGNVLLGKLREAPPGVIPGGAPR